MPPLPLAVPHRNFGGRQILETSIREKSLEFEPAFDLDGALARAREMTGRTDAGAHIGDEE